MNEDNAIEITTDDIDYLAEAWGEVDLSGALSIDPDTGTASPAQLEALINLAKALEDFLFPVQIQQ